MHYQLQDCLVCTFEAILQLSKPMPEGKLSGPSFMPQLILLTRVSPGRNTATKLSNLGERREAPGSQEAEKRAQAQGRSVL